MMKKIYSLILLFFPFISLAQPTITQSDLPVAGLVFVMGTDTGYAASITAGGPNQTWDYTGLQNLQNDTSGFMSANGTPYASMFPGSTLASYDINADQWYYFTAGTSGFYVDGFASAGTGVFRLTPGQLFAPVPFTYGNTRNNTARIQIDSVVSGINYRFIESIASSFTADGFGTLNLPSGNYTNTLRVKNTEITTDSILVDLLGIGIYSLVSATSTQATHYKWFHNGTAGYLLGIDADSLGTTATYSEYLTQYTVLSANGPKPDQSSLLSYPNPANKMVYLMNVEEAEATIIVTNAIGNEMEQKTIAGKERIEINVENYSPGIYQLTILSSGNKKNSRFTVQH
jgi:hypothetical protein